MDPAPDPDAAAQRESTLRSLGLGLIAAGALIASFVLWELYTAYATPDSSRFLRVLHGHIADRPLFQERGGEALVVGEAGAYVASVFLFILFAWLAASMAVNLIRFGVSLFAPQLPDEFKRLKQRVEALTRKPM